jgi:pimeloyl-ACP methyl ester carboxylesterase
MKVVELIDVEEGVHGLEAEYRKTPRAQGLAVDWGGHWCYWEDPEKFHQLALGFLDNAM